MNKLSGCACVLCAWCITEEKIYHRIRIGERMSTHESLALIVVSVIVNVIVVVVVVVCCGCHCSSLRSAITILLVTLFSNGSSSPQQHPFNASDAYIRKRQYTMSQFIPCYNTMFLSENKNAMPIRIWWYVCASDDCLFTAYMIYVVALITYISKFCKNIAPVSFVLHFITIISCIRYETYCRW